MESTNEVNVEMDLTVKMEPRTMTVRVSLTVVVDLDDYRLNYGGESAAEIREAVRYAAADGVRASLHNGIADVTVNDR